MRVRQLTDGLIGYAEICWSIVVLAAALFLWGAVTVGAVELLGRIPGMIVGVPLGLAAAATVTRCSSVFRT